MQGEIIPTEEKSGLAITGAERDAMSTATTRVAEQVKAAMVIAKKFPRDEAKALAKIVRACQRPALAEQSQYEYQRGGKPITGPTIRLAEAIGQSWGNIDFGITELAQDRESSVIQAFAHDLETNVRAEKTFTVPHKRFTKKGSYRLTDSRDIYELTANQGARRLRACILGIIPGDIVDRAVAECEKTLKGGSDKPLADRIREMVVTFDGIGVKAEDIVRKLGHKIEACTLHQVIGLGKTFKAIQDGFTTALAEFPPEDKATKQQEDLREKMAKGQPVQPPAAAKPNKASKKPKKATQPQAPILEPGESLDPETGEILTGEPQGPDDYDEEPAEEEAQSNPMNEREQLVAQYLDLCEAADQKPGSISGMSNEALKLHIQALKGA